MIDKKLDEPATKALKARCLHLINRQYGGVPFYVRVVKKGERYGLRGCLVHDQDQPLVEFYDARYPSQESPLGYFVSRYSLDVLQNRKPTTVDLILDTGSPNWVLGWHELNYAVLWAEQQ